MIHGNQGATKHPRRCNGTNGNGKEEEEVESIHIHLVYRLLAHSQSLPNFCNYQIVVSITISPSKRLDIKYTVMPSPSYQNVINLVVHLSIRRGPGVFMNAAMREHGAFDN
jgi:hypothetical protein